MGGSVSQSIFHELNFFLTSILYGAVYVFAYDIVKLFRMLVPHHEAVTAIEDVIFWTAVAISSFCMIFQKNDGLIRGFAFLGMVFGAGFYYISLGRVFRRIGKKKRKVRKKD